MAFLVLTFSITVVAFIAYMIYKRNEVKFEIEVSDLVATVRAMETERKNSCLVLFPESEKQEKFFQKMLRKGIVRENPLSTGGYMLNDSHKQLWKEFAGFSRSDVVHVKGTEQKETE
jgi:hypothetical protein